VVLFLPPVEQARCGAGSHSVQVGLALKCMHVLHRCCWRACVCVCSHAAGGHPGHACCQHNGGVLRCAGPAPYCNALQAHNMPVLRCCVLS
jgi:hypothetical protein